jgi:ATP/maltotriose-dependent transcriptional regulator MalT
MGMLLGLGNIAADAGEHERARELLESSRELAEKQCLFRCSGWTTLRLAELAIDAGEPQRAAQLVETALERLRPLADLWGVARAWELDQVAAKPPLSPAGEG